MRQRLALLEVVGEAVTEGNQEREEEEANSSHVEDVENPLGPPVDSTFKILRYARVGRVSPDFSIKDN